MIINTVKRDENEKGALIGYWLNENSYVPISEDNRHYRAIQKWIEEGNVPEEADPPIISPPPLDWDKAVDELDLSRLDSDTAAELKDFFRLIK
jgi:hypothetical protein